VFGAAAAASRVLGLDAERTAVALSIAASVSSGIKANFGSMAKPIQAGRAAQNGLFAARLAQMGATANPGAFEAEQGYASVFQGLETVDVDRLLAPVDEPWDIVATGLNVKRFPCCASTHGAIEAAIAVHEVVGDTAPISSVRVWTHPRRLKHTNRPTVATPFEGKFSVQYTVAAALLQGHIGLGDFTEQAVTREEVGALMRRLEASPMPEDRWADHHYAAEVDVELANGEKVLRRVERPRGVGADDALTFEQLEAKFRDCVRAGGLTDGQAGEILAALRTIEQHDELARLTKLLA
jgi:2-methylcitrate dehydratase PrpD